MTHHATNSMANRWGVTRTSQYETCSADPELLPKSYPVLWPLGKSTGAWDCICLCLTAFSVCAVSMDIVGAGTGEALTRLTSYLVPTHLSVSSEMQLRDRAPCQKPCWLHLWGSSVTSSHCMFPCFPVSYYVQCRMRSRTVLADERGGLSREAGWQFSPCHVWRSGE